MMINFTLLITKSNNKILECCYVLSFRINRFKKIFKTPLNAKFIILEKCFENNSFT